MCEIDADAIQDGSSNGNVIILNGASRAFQFGRIVQNRPESYSTRSQNSRSICALFIGLRLLFMVLGVIR